MSYVFIKYKLKIINSVAYVLEQTTPTERRTLVGEVSARPLLRIEGYRVATVMDPLRPYS
jgi:hypothetical protein